VFAVFKYIGETLSDHV